MRGGYENEADVPCYHGGRNWKPVRRRDQTAGAGGPNGEIIMDYSIHDAWRLVSIRSFHHQKDLEKDFKEIIGNRIEKQIPVIYAYQELDALPEGYEVTEGRTKPWGTGQAVLMVKGLIDCPFLVINADDY